MTTYNPPVAAYVPLASSGISSGTTSISFSNLAPYDTYKIHLTAFASGSLRTYLRLNNDSSTTYSYHMLSDDSGAGTGFVTSSTATGYGDTIPGFAFSNIFHQEFTLYMCQDTGVWKNTFVETYYSGDHAMFAGINYPSTSAISDIEIFTSANSLSSGHVAIYGLGI